MKDDLIGKSLGQFEIIDEIGRGGMASVYRAKQTSINRIVAIKVLPRSLLHDPSFYERFVREVDVVAHLEHPHILPIYDYGEVDGTPYIAMRYLAGGSMAQWIWRGLPPLDRLPKPVQQIASALDYAHQEGVIHRDLKPGNILMDENGNAYLGDFGIARVLDSNLTGSGIIGTPAYMSPEQANGLPLDARSDIYSLGVVLFELVTGHEPFEAETPVALLLKHIKEPMPSAQMFRPELPRDADRVIGKATAKQPEDRYASAGDLSEAFSQAILHPTMQDEDDEDQPTIFDPELLLKRTPLAPMEHPPAVTPPPAHPSSVAPPPPVSAPSIPAPLPIEAAVTQAQPTKRRTPWALIAVVVVVLVVAAGAIALFATRGTAPPATAVAAIPTPFPDAMTVRRPQYTISVPNDWTFTDLTDEFGTVHVWNTGPNASIAVRLIDKAKLANPGATPDFNTAADAYDSAVIRPQPGWSLIDTSTAEDGTIRRSYRFSGTPDSTVQPGQTDVFFLDRGNDLVVIEMYAAYGEGNDLVPTFQSVLDSLRVSDSA